MITAGFTCGIPNLKGNTLPKGYLELLEQKRYSPSTVKTYRAYFSDFMEYHKGRNIDRLKVPDINKYILYLVNEKKISVSQQNMRINAIKFYYEQVKGGKRQYYGGITRAKEYKSLPEVLSKNEIKRILAQIFQHQASLHDFVGFTLPDLEEANCLT